jgi:hypothetical protein
MLTSMLPGEREGEFVCPTGADVPAGPDFCNKFSDPGCIDNRGDEIFLRVYLMAFSSESVQTL